MLRIFFVFLCLTTLAFSQEQVQFETLPVPTGATPSTDPSIPKINWHRWTVKEFTIHAIDKDQGKFLYENVSKIKSWSLTRWGLEDFQYTKECRIFVASDVTTMKKLFNIDISLAEIRDEQVSYIWLIMDRSPAEVIPPSLTIINLKELEKQNQVKIPWWCYRGSAVLNGTLPQIRKNIDFVGPYLKNDKTMFFSKTLFTMTEDDWRKQTPEMRNLFDAESVILCLMVRKEYGQRIFLQFLNQDCEKVLQELRFRNYNQVDSVLKRYMAAIVDDAANNKIPDAYLQITKVE